MSEPAWITRARDAHRALDASQLIARIIEGEENVAAVDNVVMDEPIMSAVTDALRHTKGAGVDPDYYRRDEHVIRLRIEGNGTVVDGGAETEIMRGLDRINGSLASLHKQVNSLRDVVRVLEQRVNNPPRTAGLPWNDVDEVLPPDFGVVGARVGEPFPTPKVVDPEFDITAAPTERLIASLTPNTSPLDFYLHHPGLSQEAVARTYHMRVSSMRNQLWAEAAARGLTGALATRTAHGHRNGGVATQQKYREQRAALKAAQPTTVPQPTYQQRETAAERQHRQRRSQLFSGGARS